MNRGFKKNKKKIQPALTCAKTHWTLLTTREMLIKLLQHHLLPIRSGKPRTLITNTVGKLMGNQASTGIVRDGGEQEELHGRKRATCGRFLEAWPLSHHFGNLLYRYPCIHVERQHIICYNEILGTAHMPSRGRLLNNNLRYSYTMEY